MFTSLPKRNNKPFTWKFLNGITNKIFVRAWRFPQGRTPLTARTRTDIYYIHTLDSKLLHTIMTKTIFREF